MAEYIISGAMLRLSQTIIYSSIWIVIGCLIAAVFRRMMGPDKVKRLFADGTRWGLLSGWLMGMLLPVCSLGVIPVVREMHRAGVRRGTIVAFGLTAPLFNPMSVLYGLTLSDPLAILSFSLCALIVVTILGLIWDRFVVVDDETSEMEDLPAVGIKRSIAVFYSASRELVGPSMGYMVVGVLGSVILAVSLGKGYLQNQVERDNPAAPITVALVATPIYTTPLLAMSQIGGMFQHGNSIGAAFTLLVLGAGANIGLLAWFGSAYGFRRVLFFYLLLCATSIGLAYAIDKPLIPKGVDPAGHTHAFDVYTHPFHPQQKNLFAVANYQAQEFWQANEFGGTYALAGLLLLGVLFTIAATQFDVEDWFCKQPANQSAGFDRVLPGWVLGAVSIAGLVIASIVGCYLYYPAPDEVFADMDIINTNCLISSRTKEWDAADKWIRYCDDLSRRLEVGVYLRTGKVDEFQSAKAKIYREKLDVLKEVVNSKDEDRVEDVSKEVSGAFRRMKSSFLDGSLQGE